MAINEMKSLRLSTETKQALDAILSNFPNADKAVNAMLQALKTSEMKELIPSRACEIDEMSVHIKAIQEMYLQSVQFSNNAEKRAEERFSSRIELLASENQKLKSKLSELTEEMKQREKDFEYASQAKNSIAILQASLEKAENALKQQTNHDEELKTLRTEKAVLESKVSIQEERISDLKNALDVLKTSH